jgi:hypothetical protein
MKKAGRRENKEMEATRDKLKVERYGIPVYRE